MVKKFNLLAAVLCFSLCMHQSVLGQESPPQDTSQHNQAQWSSRDMTYRGQNYDPLDTAFIPKNRMPQQKKFLNHQYFFPAKPQSMWEVGVGFGQYNVIGDVPSLMYWKKGGYGLHLQVRKSLGYVFSMRMQYVYAIGKGLDWQTSYNFGNNPAWTSSGYYPTGNALGAKPTPIVNNYRMESHQLNLDFMFNLNNLKFHRARTMVSFYGFVGLGAFAYNTRINTKDANGQPYNFAAIIGNTPQTYSNRNQVRSALQSAMGSNYDAPAENTLETGPKLGNKTLDWCPSFGVGAQYRINARVNLQIEDRFSIPSGDDLLDGKRWAESTTPIMTPNNDYTNYFSIGVNFNLGNKKKNVEPLYWLNPLEFAYNEMNYPRHMILPDPVLPDSDGDGVADQFDKCPGTPPGVSVDSHGCPMDTDGDGVPDYRDKQLITPTECQPVDADGVGHCPCPEGCNGMPQSTCGTIGSGSVTFPANSSSIGGAMQVQLATLSAQMQANPTCKVVITGAGSGNKQEQQRSWDRVNAIIQYMSEKNGINRNRFIFQYGTSGVAEKVTYRAAMPGEEGPSNVAPPFPDQMQKNK